MIRQDKVHAITCTGANLEDVYNLVAHDHYERVPNYRDPDAAGRTEALLEKN
jgi:deoxyhypusine synthase